jgi:hypothetical protein
MSYSSIDFCGNKYWYDNNSRRHREDGPAIVPLNMQMELKHGISMVDDIEKMDLLLST